MKKKLLISVLCSFLNLITIYSEPVDLSTAISVAKIFYSSATTDSGLPTSKGIFDFILVEAPTFSMQREGTKGLSEEVLFYIFNVGDNNGFVIVSGDDVAKPILGYSLSGKYSTENASPALRNWLNGYKSEIVYALEHQLVASKEIVKIWENLQSKGEINPVNPVVGPLLGDIQWHQYTPFNDLCPSCNTTKAPAGCVAIALGQIMKYHNYPNNCQNPNGSSTFTYWDLPDIPDIDNPDWCNIASIRTINFDDVQTNWDFIPDNFNSPTTDFQKTEVANFIASLGHSVKMDYAIVGSGSNIDDALLSLQNIYNYDSQIKLLERQSFSQQAWFDIIKNEIDAGRPIYYRGSDPNAGKHAWVCDGYDSNNNIHFNWGWNDTYLENGYYPINAIDINNGLRDYGTDNKIISQIKLPKDQYEPNNSESSATLINEQLQDFGITNITRTGSIDELNDEDFYYLNLPAGSNYEIGIRVFEFGHNDPITFYSGNVNLAYKTNTWQQSVDYQVSEFTVINGGSLFIMISGNKLPARYNTGTYKLEISCTPKSNASISSGQVQPSQGLTNVNTTFLVKYTDPKNVPPSSIFIKIDDTNYQMTKDPIDNIFTDGVNYTYSTTFISAKTYSYGFHATASDGTILKPFPESGNLNYVVVQNATGWKAAVDPTGTYFSPSSVNKGTPITVYTIVRNNGIFNYSNIPLRVEMRDPQGNLVGYNDSGTGVLAPNTQKTMPCQLTIPLNGIDGKYNITSQISPALDSDPENNSVTNSFFIGENLGNEQFRSSTGPQNIYYHTNLNINGKNFYVNGINTSGKSVTLRDPAGTLSVVYQGFCKVYGTLDSFVACYSIGSDATGTYASLYGAYAISNGPIFDNTEINANPGTTVYAYANVPTGSGYLFANNSRTSYELHSTDEKTDIKLWFNSISREGTYARIRIRFDIPSSAKIGKTTLYFRTEYSNISLFDFTRLTFYITEPQPTLSSLSKTNISSDDIITISGNNLGTTGTIKFGEIIATNIISWTSTSITCQVPQNISNGLVTVNGTSNGLGYTVISSTGNPILIFEIPDQTMNPDETRTIANLNDVFKDPNEGTLTFSATSNNPDISLGLSLGILQLKASSNLLINSTITITATDNTNKSVSDQFVIIAPKVMKINPSVITVPCLSGSVTYSVVSNIDWIISENSNWLSVNKTNASTLTVNYDENLTYLPKSAVIRISGTGVSDQSVSLYQLSPVIEQEIPISNGWNIISSNLLPENSSMQNVLGQLIQDGSLTKVQDESGRAIEFMKVGYENDWEYGFTKFQNTEGYKVRVNNDNMLKINGIIVTLPLDINLMAGWNIIGFPTSTPQDPSVVFSSLIQSGILRKVMDENGNSFEYNPDLGIWIDGITNLVPGKGYKVNVTNNSYLRIIDRTSGKKSENTLNYSPEIYFKRSWIGKGFDHMNFFFTSGKGLDNGDEIAVFDGENCVGVSVIGNPSDKYVSLVAIADDPLTGETDGFVDGHTFTFHIWDKDTNSEYEDVKYIILNGYPNVFSKFSTSVISMNFSSILTGIENKPNKLGWLADAYPNPSLTNTTFSFQLANASKVRLEILDFMGNSIRIIVDQDLPEGFHQVEWDNRTSTGSKIASGTYFYRLSSFAFSQTKLLVIK